MGALSKATIDDIDVHGKRVLLREDLNVPMRDGVISDDRRIREAIPTIEALRSRNARVIVVAHLGRPKGRIDDTARLGQIAARLSSLLGADVRLASDVVGDSAHSMVESLRDGDVGMLENVRFEPGEETNDPAFAEQLAAFGDIYVNDAFGTAHRAHASTEGVAHLLPAVAGKLMARELEMLGGVMDNPRTPVVAIVGGSKISTKVGVLDHLLDRVDVLWVGGAMACTFYRALGESTGTSLVEEEQVQTAKRLLDSAGGRRADLRLPIDAVVVERAVANAPAQVVAWKAIPDGWMVVDAGPDTVGRIAADCAGAGTIIWNGPLGVYEIPDFAAGTRDVARAVAASKATSVIGGGDLAAAVQDAGVADKIGFISTGGGATIEFLEGRTLPGIAALRDREVVRR
jgi:3-phosphoglycerate kinase